MIHPLSVTDLERATATFNDLKNTARSIRDVEAWFTQHPELIPGLPRALEGNLTVSFEHMEGTTNSKRGVFVDTYELNISAEDGIDKKQDNPLEVVTGLKMAKTLVASATFSLRCEMQFDSKEWRFVAADALYDLCDSDLADSVVSKICKKVLATHFPALTLEAFRNLRATGILPSNAKEFTDWLFSLNTSKQEVSLPHNLAVQP